MAWRRIPRPSGATGCRIRTRLRTARNDLVEPPRCSVSCTLRTHDNNVFGWIDFGSGVCDTTREHDVCSCVVDGRYDVRVCVRLLGETWLRMKYKRQYNIPSLARCTAAVGRLVKRRVCASPISREKHAELPCGRPLIVFLCVPCPFCFGCGGEYRRVCCSEVLILGGRLFSLVCFYGKWVLAREIGCGVLLTSCMHETLPGVAPSAAAAAAVLRPSSPILVKSMTLYFLFWGGRVTYSPPAKSSAVCKYSIHLRDKDVRGLCGKRIRCRFLVA